MNKLEIEDVNLYFLRRRQLDNNLLNFLSNNKANASTEGEFNNVAAAVQQCNKQGQKGKSKGYFGRDHNHTAPITPAMLTSCCSP